MWEDNEIDETGKKLAKEVAAWMTEYYGPRCEEFVDGCLACRAWQGYDYVFKDLEKY